MNPRQISIFNYLLEQNDYVTAKTISKEFNVTPKTIYIDINILQEELIEYELSIDKKTNCGILLVSFIGIGIKYCPLWKLRIKGISLTWKNPASSLAATFKPKSGIPKYFSAIFHRRISKNF